MTHCDIDVNPRSHAHQRNALRQQMIESIYANKR